MIGHWEIAGIILINRFLIRKVSDDVIMPLDARALGQLCRVGNRDNRECRAHGNRFSIVSPADSVFQIAVHESIIPVDEFYDMCERRTILTEHAVGRVIAVL